MVKEADDLLIATQDDTITISGIKAKTDYTQLNSKCSFCGNNDETINIKSRCGKLTQKVCQNLAQCVGIFTGNCARN